jgi:outer membrane protein assembly factor BamB
MYVMAGFTMKADFAMTRLLFLGLVSSSIVLGATSSLPAEDWRQFLGSHPEGSRSQAAVAVRWSDAEGIRWKRQLPGPGSSSPIVVGGRVYVTCYAGYGVGSEGGSSAALVRHLLCIDRTDGHVVWERKTPASQPEDVYRGYISDHGYASNTPVSDGERIYVFYGKSGVLAFDLDGTERWRTSVGDGSSEPRWGSGASLTLWNELVIVNAAEESHAILALNKRTGKEVWRYSSDALELCYGTPRLITSAGGQQQLVMGALGEAWGLAPATGELLWFAKTALTDNVNPSPVAGNGVAYLFGGFRSSGSIAIRLGGTDDVTDSHIVWTSKSSSYVATPVLHEGHLYWIDYHGKAFCISAATGEEIYRQRVPGFDTRRPVYASPLLAGGKLYVVTRKQGVYVLDAAPQFRIAAINKIAVDESQFNATPAISDGELFLRSDRFLYCIGKP